MHFQQDEDKRLSPRTGRTNLQLARNWLRISAQHPEGVSSQRQDTKAIAAIVQADKSDPDGASSAARSRTGRGATGSGAMPSPRPFPKGRGRNSVPTPDRARRIFTVCSVTRGNRLRRDTRVAWRAMNGHPRAGISERIMAGVQTLPSAIW